MTGPKGVLYNHSACIHEHYTSKYHNPVFFSYNQSKEGKLDTLHNLPNVVICSILCNQVVNVDGVVLAYSVRPVLSRIRICKAQQFTTQLND